jgi:hypothetical protein
MKKLVWVLIIAAGVFLGMFAYEKFQQREFGDIQAELDEIQADQDKSEQAEGSDKDSAG